MWWSLSLQCTFPPFLSITFPHSYASKEILFISLTFQWYCSYLHVKSARCVCLKFFPQIWCPSDIKCLTQLRLYLGWVQVELGFNKMKNCVVISTANFFDDISSSKPTHLVFSPKEMVRKCFKTYFQELIHFWEDIMVKQ